MRFCFVYYLLKYDLVNKTSISYLLYRYFIYIRIVFIFIRNRRGFYKSGIKREPCVNHGLSRNCKYQMRFCLKRVTSLIRSTARAGRTAKNGTSQDTCLF
jgi:hypothetical protein